MHGNLRQPDAAQTLCALISSHVPSSKSLSLSVAVLERIYCLYVALRCDLELWPPDLDLWLLTLNICSVPAMPKWNSVRNLSSIGQSAAELLQFELWPYDLEHCITYALRYFTQSLNSVKLSVHEMWRLFDANTSYHAMTLTVDPRPWTFVVDRASCGQTLQNVSKIAQPAAELLTI